MPELADVARAATFVNAHLVGKRIAKVEAVDDPFVFGRAKTNYKAVQEAFTGKEIVSVTRHGKYLCLIMSAPPHAVMHFNMTGWLMIKGVDTQAYRRHVDWTVWPPKYLRMKFIFDDNETEAAFSDSRRLGKIYVVNCPAEKIREHRPLDQCGPDALNDMDSITEEWLATKLHGRSATIKAILINQSIISGLGSWMADEVLFHAKIHPETPGGGLTSAQISDLRSAIRYVCSIAVDLNGIVESLPSDWLVHHRELGQGVIMENGETVSTSKVRGITARYVPAVQGKVPTSGSAEKA